MKIKDIPLENRPRERMKKLGLDVLSDAELLSIVLQKGTAKENVVDMSNRLISSVDKLSDCSLAELNELNLFRLKLIVFFAVEESASELV